MQNELIVHNLHLKTPCCGKFHEDTQKPYLFDKISEINHFLTSLKGELFLDMSGKIFTQDANILLHCSCVCRCLNLWPKWF